MGKRKNLIMYIIMLCIFAVITNLPSIYFKKTLSEAKNGVLFAEILTIFILLTALYISAVLNYENTDKKDIKKIFFIAAVIAIFIYPTISNDIFYYISYGTAAEKYSINPYITTISDIIKIHYEIPFTVVTGAGKQTPMTYGYLYAMYLKLICFLSFKNCFVAFYAIKSINVVILYLVIKELILFNKDVDEELWYLLIGINPLILIEFIGNGHNDLIFMLPILISLRYLNDKKYFKSALFFIIAFHIKSSILFYGVFYIVFYIKNKVKLKNILVMFFVCSLSFIPYILIYHLYEIPDGIIRYSYFSDVSFPTTIASILQGIHLYKKDELLNRSVSLCRNIFIIVYCIQVIYYLINKNNSLKALIKNAAFCYIFYTSLSSAAFFPWYFLWILPLLLILKKYDLCLISILISLYELIWEFVFFTHLTLAQKSVLLYGLLALISIIFVRIKRGR